MAKAQDYQDYHAMSSELEQILAELQQEDIDIDAAMKRYERGLQLIAELETYLKTAETKITKLKSSAEE